MASPKKKRNKPRKWMPHEFGMGSDAYDAVLPVPFRNEDYLLSGTPLVSRREIEHLGKNLKITRPLSDSALNFINLAFSKYRHGHSLASKAPLKSNVKKVIERLNKQGKAIQDTLDQLYKMAKKKKDDVNYAGDCHEARTILHLLENVYGRAHCCAESYSAVKELRSSTGRYLAKYKPAPNRPRYFYIYEFIFILGAAFKEWTGDRPMQANGVYRHLFFRFVVECTNLMQPRHRLSLRAVETLTKNISF